MQIVTYLNKYIYYLIMMVFSKIISFFKRFLKGSNVKSKKPIKIITKGSILIIAVGTYVSDSGSSDYSVNFKIKKGKVYKKCIRKMRINEDTYMFNTFELKPITFSAFLEVRKTYLSSNYFEVYNILLVKNLKKYKVIKI